MRKLLSIVLLLPVFTYAQTWVPVGNGISSGGHVNTLFVHDSVMYAGGYFSSPGNNIAQWNNTAWSNLGLGINNRVYAFGLYKDTLYVGGDFTEAGGHSAGSIAKWDGSSFSNAGFDFQGGAVSTFCVYNSLLYIGGGFDLVNYMRPSGLVSWNGKKTDSVVVKYAQNFNWTEVYTLSTYDNTLALGFGDIGNYYGGGIGIWYDSTYRLLGNELFYSDTSHDGFQNALYQADTLLYLGGYFKYIGDEINNSHMYNKINSIAMWNGKAWSALGTGIHGTVNAIVSYNKLIVAGGNFDSAGGIPVNNIAAWDGKKWSALGSGLNGAVLTLAVFDSNLYAGGTFTSPAYGIAEFNPTLKITPSIPVINNDSINVFPNPNNGQFTVVCNRSITTGNQPIIEIYNNLGQKVYSTDLVDGTNLIDMGKPAKGVYLYKITSAGNNLINPGKLVIE